MQLVDLIDEHTAAFAYDWRVRFGLSIFESLAGRVAWVETFYLFRELTSDPSSHVAAKVHGYQFPLSREGFIAADTYDVLMAANWNGKGKKPKPYPRPTDEPPTKFGDAAGRTRDEVLAIFAAHGHAPQSAPTSKAPQPRDALGRFVARPRPEQKG